MNHSRLLVHVVPSTIHHKHLNVVVKTYCTRSVNDHRHFPSGNGTMYNRQCRKAKLPSPLFLPFVFHLRSVSISSWKYMYIYIFSNLAARYIEENRVTARVTNQISIRLQNTFLREYRRRTPGGTFTRRFVHVIDAHDRSELAMGSSSIVRNQAKFHVQLNLLFDSRTSIYFWWISIFERTERKIKMCEHSSL